MAISKEGKVDDIKRQVDPSISSFYMTGEVKVGVYLFLKYLLCTYFLPDPVVDTRDAGRVEDWVIEFDGMSRYRLPFPSEVGGKAIS